MRRRRVFFTKVWAARNFVRKFVISDDMEVKGAALSNGMLYIGMERLIPEQKSQRKLV
ncbi:MAG: hypothetical protein Ct9H90mP13_12570 [Pseudomonadota bacterium]|nr:MAG: hypothetical protein Ct9H90mP13_12570 [Pseudomonadota bacterium]